VKPEIVENFIDLLSWVKERNLAPEVPANSDLFVCPFTRKMSRYRNLKPHQRRTALWIPTAKGLNRQGFRVRMKNLGHLVMAESHKFQGAGPGEHEAMLSLLNRVRLAKAS